MGSKRKTENSFIPPMMRVRRWKSGRGQEKTEKILFTLDSGGKPRKEAILSRDSIYDAISEYERLARPLTEEEKHNLISAFSDPIDESESRRMFITMVKGAATRKIQVSITENDILDKLRESEMRCAITGIMFNSAKPQSARMRPWIPSIDRIDSKLGYTKDNIRIVCACVNLALNQFGDDIFIRIATQTVKMIENRSATNCN